MRGKASTIYDVARAAGVSTATVSRAISGGSVSEATRAKVEAAIREVGYAVPAPAARGRRTVAMVLSAQTSPYYASMCEGATAEAARAGYLPLCFSYPDGTDIRRITEDLLSRPLAGVMLAGFAVENRTDLATTRSCLRQLQRALPLVAIGPPIEGIECARLTSDPSQCVRKSIAHFAMLGHRRIAFLGGDRSASFSRIREQAYREETERRGCEVRPDYIALTGCNAPAGELAVGVLLGGLSRDEYPTAVFCINDLVALGAMRQLSRLGLRVPEDVAVIGCDNAFFAQYLTPSLTTVDLHPRAHGRSAMAELIAAIEGGRSMSFNDGIEASLVVRESCGAHLGIRRFE